MAFDPKRYQPGEGCIRHTDGSISDAGFFDLEDEPPMDRAEIVRTRERMIEKGWSQEDVEAMFPLVD